MAAAILLPAAISVNAREKDDFGSWQTITLDKKFAGKWNAGVLFEHRSKNDTKDLDCAVVMPYIQYKALPWLAFSFDSETVALGDRKMQITFRPAAILTHSIGNFNLSLRELPLYEYTFDTKASRWLLRTRGKVSFNISDTCLTPYAAAEVFTTTKWEKTRYFLGTDISLSDHSTLGLYYVCQHFPEFCRHTLCVSCLFSF